MRTDAFYKEIFRFFKKHFDRTTLFAFAAVFFISWAKYSIDRFACLDGNCVEVLGGKYFSRAECRRSCASIESLQPEHALPMRGSAQNPEITALWERGLRNGNVWYSNILQPPQQVALNTESSVGLHLKIRADNDN